MSRQASERCELCNKAIRSTEDGQGDRAHPFTTADGEKWTVHKQCVVQLFKGAFDEVMLQNAYPVPENGDLLVSNPTLRKALHESDWSDVDMDELIHEPKEYLLTGEFAAKAMVGDDIEVKGSSEFAGNYVTSWGMTEAGWKKIAVPYEPTMSKSYNNQKMRKDKDNGKR